MQNVTSVERQRILEAYMEGHHGKSYTARHQAFMEQFLDNKDSFEPTAHAIMMAYETFIIDNRDCHSPQG